jgi:type II secretion system protein H
MNAQLPVKPYKARSQQGFSLIELLIVMMIIGIIAGLAVVGLRGLRNDLGNSASQLEAQVKLARARAMTTTRAYRLVQVSDKRIEAEWSFRCSDDNGWTNDARIWFELPTRVEISETQKVQDNIIICFTSRGIATTNPVLTLQDNKGDTAELEIFLGGAVEVTQ